MEENHNSEKGKGGKYKGCGMRTEDVIVINDFMYV